MVSTFAVTASGAAVLAATEELLARTAAAGRPTDGLGLGDVLGYIWTRKLEVEGEGDALGYACSCTPTVAAATFSPTPTALVHPPAPCAKITRQGWCRKRSCRQPPSGAAAMKVHLTMEARQ